MKFLNYRNILIIYFLYLIIGICIYSSLQISEFPKKYVFTEWLINYEGGYIRRGLLGQLVFDISEIFEINIKYLILIFQITSYFIYFTIFYFIFSKVEINFFWLLIIFSPILFAYPLVELMVLGRKDIFVISIFLFFSIINFKSFRNLFIFFLIAFGLSTFVHEITFFYIFHYLFIVYLYNKLILKEKIKLIYIFLFLIFSSVLLYLNLYLHNQANINEIVDSYKSYNFENFTIYSGAFSHLIPNFETVLKGTINQIEFLNLIKYLIIFLLNSFPFIYFIKFKNVKYLSTYNIFLLFFLLSIPVYALVLDWGRVIYINYNFFIILLLFFIKLNLIDLAYLNNKISKLSYYSKIIVFIIICLLFSPDILSFNPIEFFPLPSQFLRFTGGFFEKILEFY